MQGQLERRLKKTELELSSSKEISTKLITQNCNLLSLSIKNQMTDLSNKSETNNDEDQTATLINFENELDKIQNIYKLKEVQLSQKIVTNDHERQLWKEEKNQYESNILQMNQKLIQMKFEKNELESKLKSIEILKNIVDEEKEKLRIKLDEWERESGFKRTQLETIHPKDGRVVDIDSPSSEPDFKTSQDILVEKLQRATDIEHKLNIIMGENINLEKRCRKFEKQLILTKAELAEAKLQVEQFCDLHVRESEDRAEIAEKASKLHTEIATTISSLSRKKSMKSITSL